MARRQPAPSQGSWIKNDQDFDHIQELAQQLVRHLGVAGARKTCLDNRWKGVLAVIDRTG
ncbi:MAG: hypothetical protein ACOY99_01155 [Pseudomonadota bacterium]